jgi:hypothetical protein
MTLLGNASRSPSRRQSPLPSNRPVTASEPVGELSGIGIRRVFPDEMAAFEELMMAIGQVLREQLPVRRRNDRIIPAGKNKHGRLDAWLGKSKLVTRSLRYG